MCSPFPRSLLRLRSPQLFISGRPLFRPISLRLEHIWPPNRGCSLDKQGHFATIEEIFTKWFNLLKINETNLIGADCSAGKSVSFWSIQADLRQF